MTTPTRVDGGSAIEFAAPAHIFRIKKKTDAGFGMLGVVLEGRLVHVQEKVAVSHSFSIVCLLNRDFCSGEDDVFWLFGETRKDEREQLRKIDASTPWGPQVMLFSPVFAVSKPR